MLVLSRKKNESICIGSGIEVTVLEVQGNRVKLGFRSPNDVVIHRSEIHERIMNAPPALEHAECC
jgi:carbon storage regulator